MTATRASVTRPPAGLLDAVRDRYELPSLELGERLEGGYANDVFRVDADGEPWVLRVEHPPWSREDIAWEHRLVGLLAPGIPEIPAPLQAADGTTFFAHGEFAAWLLPYVAGRPADRDDERHRLGAARLLGRLHGAAAEVELPPRPARPPLRQLQWPQLGRYGPELEARREAIERARSWAIRLVDELRGRPLQRSAIHGDVFSGNVLAAGGRIVGLVDWEEATVDWTAYELGNAMWEFCKRGDTLDVVAGKRFTAAYRSAGGTVPPAEDDVLVPLARVKRILEILRAPTDRHVDWDYQLHNLRAFQNLGG